MSDVAKLAEQARIDIEALVALVEEQAAKIERLREYYNIAHDYRFEAEARAERAEAERDVLRAMITAHHEFSTLSKKALAEYDFHSCPVCARSVSLQLFEDDGWSDRPDSAFAMSDFGEPDA